MRLKGLLKGKQVTVKVYSDGHLIVQKGSISTLDLRKQTLLIKDETGEIRTLDLSNIIDISSTGGFEKN